jgi:non-ribosomal peptide synthetase component F
MAEDLQRVSITQWIEYQVGRSPDAIAVIDQQQQLTYQQLNARANQFAHHLKGLGIGYKTLVGIYLERSLDLIIGLLGILKAGGTYIPLEPHSPQTQLTFILADSQLAFLVSQSSLLEKRVPALQPLSLIDLDRDHAAIQQQPTDNPIHEIQPDDLAYVTYSLNSTGDLSGFATEQGQMVRLIDWATQFFTAEQLQGVLASTSLCFDLAGFEIFVTLSCGGTVILAQDVMQLPKLAAASQVTLINTTPSTIPALLRQHDIFRSVRAVNLVGESVPQALVQHLYQLEQIQRVCIARPSRAEAECQPETSTWRRYSEPLALVQCLQEQRNNGDSAQRSANSDRLNQPLFPDPLKQDERTALALERQKRIIGRWNYRRQNSHDLSVESPL